MIQKLSLFIFFICSATSAHAQAFGVQQGDSILKHGGKPTPSKGVYIIQVPQPNPSFESYIAVATPQNGICKVTGVGKSFNSDDYGTELKSLFTRLKTTLQNKYGKSRDFDFLRQGALWKEPREYGWSLYKNERTLASFWNAEQGSTNLGSLNGVSLEAKASSPDSTYVNLSYEFSNMGSCLSVIRAGEDQGL